MQDSESGSTIITAPIITIGMFFVICISIVIAIEVIKPFIVYEKISSVALKYIFIMEEYGYLNDLEKKNLVNELEDKGIDRNRLIIYSDVVKKEYGEPISLKIKYEYVYRLYRIVNLMKGEEKELGIPIIIEKKSFSKI